MASKRWNWGAPLLVVLTCLACGIGRAPAQTVVLFEGFEGVFLPFPFGWTVGDSNALGTTLYWDRVDSAYGGEGTRNGSYKGYCAGTGPGGDNLLAIYPVNMTSVMFRSVNLAAYSRANLRFWRKVPSIGTGDSWRVQLNGNNVASSSSSITTWNEVSININTYAGGSPVLRFEFISDAATTGEGLYLDDIEVTGANVPLTERLDDFSITNFTGYVIDADLNTNNPAFNRESLLANSVFTAENFQSATTNQTYRFTYRLRETNGVLFPVHDATGTNSVTSHVSTNSIALGNGDRITITNFASLRPAARLNHRTRYNLELEVARTNGVVLFRSTNGPMQFYHFTNLVSGDAAFNTFAEFDRSGLERTWILDTAPGSNGFPVTNVVAFHRYDEFMVPTAITTNIPVRLDVELRNATTDALVPLANSFSNYNIAVNNYTLGTSNPPEPRERTNTLVLNVRPAGQLNSVDSLYRIIVRMTCTNQPGQPGALIASITNGPARLLHFNGNFIFGDIDTTFVSLTGNPPFGAPVIGSHIPVGVPVSPGAGTLNGDPAQHYGNGLPIVGNLQIDGDVIATGAPVTVTGPDTGKAGNIPFERIGLVLDPNGARANVRFTMPAGFGYNTNIAEAVFQRRLESDLLFTGIGLNASLAPKSNLVYVANMVAAEESKSVFIVASQMEWDSTASRFILTPAGTEALHVRSFDYVSLALQTTNLFKTNSAVKLSNDRYFQFADQIDGNVIVTADAHCSALVTMGLVFAASGNFRTHFPYDSEVSWNGGGTMRILNDAIAAGTDSQLLGAQRVMTPYSADCDGCGGTGTTNLIGVTPPGGTLFFTRDGGLVTDGATTPEYGTIGPPATSVNGRLAWGYIPSLNAHAQSVLAPTNAAFYMPGAFVRGADNTSTDEDGPGVILLTGVASTNLNLIERPKTAGYLSGRADYAGLNIRILGDSFRDGRSTIAAQTVNYKLRGNSKYYARLGGVSGMHSAMPGTFPTNLTLLGYQFTFFNYSLSYLDSLNFKSRTEGSVHVPDPSDFDLAFEEMKFSCPGGLLSAKIPSGTGMKTLKYWNFADFQPLSLNFVPTFGDECDPGQGTLALGVRAYASHVVEPLNGTLGFNPNGTLVPKSQNVPGIDSRLQMPGNVRMKGPNGTEYVINPTGYAYYNKYDPGRVEVGFLNAFGKMNIPFFEDLKVHLHLTPKMDSPGDDRPVYLMGGWPRVGSGNANLGWQESGEDPFTASYFDPDNRGLPPPGLSLADYRNGPSEQYHPRAVKLWLDIVDLDYPMTWNNTLRSFKSFQTVSNDLIIIKVTHEVTYLDAKTAVLDFGAKYDGLPKISISNMLLDELEDSGVLSAIQDTIGSAASDALGTGFEALSTMLGDNPEKLIDEVLSKSIDPLLDPLLNGLQGFYNSLPQASKWQFTNEVNVKLLDFSKNVSNAIYQISNPIDAGANLIKTIDGKIVEVTNAICQVTDVLIQGTNIAVLTAGLIDQLASQFSDSASEPGLSGAIDEVRPTIDQVNEALGQVKGVIGQLRGPIMDVNDWAGEMNDAIQSSANAINSAMTTARLQLMAFFASLNYAVDNPFTHYSKAELKARVKKEIIEETLGKQFVADIQSATKQRLYDYDAAFKQGLDTYFQQINQVIRDLISQSLAAVDDTINAGLDTIGQYLGAGQISGHAVINDDSLRLLRIDAKFQLKIPDEFELHAFLEIKELDSENTAPGCLPGSGKATEVTIGAIDVDLDWISPELRCDIQVKFTLENNKPIGIGGAIELRGKLDFGGFTVKQLGLGVAFGKLENYVAANCRVKVGTSVEIAGGVFFGRACSIDPITIAVAAVSPYLVTDINPTEIFGEPPFTGAFVYGEGTFPIWSYGCLFEVRLTLGAGGWYFIEGPRYGGLIKAGVGGTVICVLSASGTMTLIGSKKPEGMVFVGLAHVEGCLGPCPFCICVDAETDVKYTEGGGDEWSAKEP